MLQTFRRHFVLKISAPEGDPYSALLYSRTYTYVIYIVLDIKSLIL